MFSKTIFRKQFQVVSLVFYTIEKTKKRGYSLCFQPSALYYLTFFLSLHYEYLHLCIYNCSLSIVNSIAINTSPIQYPWFTLLIFWSFFARSNKMRMTLLAQENFVGKKIAIFVGNQLVGFISTSSLFSNIYWFC